MADTMPPEETLSTHQERDRPALLAVCRFSGYLLLAVGYDQPGLVYHVGGHRDRGRAPLHQLAGQFRIDRRALAADGAGDLAPPAGGNHMLQRSQHRGVALVKNLRQLRVVPVDSQNKLSEVVGPDGYSIDANVQELVKEEHVGGDLYHHPELEVLGTPQPERREELFGLHQFLDRPNKGDHDPEVLVPT